MTNLLAAVVVALVTNVSSEVKTEYANTVYAIHPQPPIESWEAKYETTTVEEVVTATFELDGKEVVTERRTKLSETVQRYVQQKEWVPDGGPREGTYIELPYGQMYFMPSQDEYQDLTTTNSFITMPHNGVMTLNGNGEIESEEPYFIKGIIYNE